VRDPVRQGGGLAGAGAGDDQQRGVAVRGGRGTLGRVERGERVREGLHLRI